MMFLRESIGLMPSTQLLYVCTYVCTYVCVSCFVCSLCENMHMYENPMVRMSSTSVCIHANSMMYTYVHQYIRTYVCMYVCTYIRNMLVHIVILWYVCMLA